MTPRIGDLIFVRSNALLSKAIRWWTGSKFSHVAVYFGRGLVIESIYGGVQLSLMSKYNKSDYEIVPLPSRISRVKFARALFRHIGDGYDYSLFFGLFLIEIFPFVRHIIDYFDSSYSEICIEYVIESLKELGETFPQFEDTDLMLPDDLYNIYYEGTQ